MEDQAEIVSVTPDNQIKPRKSLVFIRHFVIFQLYEVLSLGNNFRDLDFHGSLTVINKSE